MPNPQEPFQDPWWYPWALWLEDNIYLLGFVLVGFGLGILLMYCLHVLLR